MADNVLNFQMEIPEGTPENHLPLNLAAMSMGLSGQWLRRMISEGRVESLREKNKLYVSMTEIDRIKTEGAGKGKGGNGGPKQPSYVRNLVSAKNAVAKLTDASDADKAVTLSTIDKALAVAIQRAQAAEKAKAAEAAAKGGTDSATSAAPTLPAPPAPPKA